MINEQLVKQKLLSSSEYLKNISEILKQYSVDEFKNNFSIQLQMERSFEVVNQIIIDICTHILSTYSETPQNYANCFEILHKKNIIGGYLSEDLIKSVRMRNLIVHQYTVIDYAILYCSLSKLQNTFADFKTQILNWLSKTQG